MSWAIHANFFLNASLAHAENVVLINLGYSNDKSLILSGANCICMGRMRTPVF